MNFLSRNWRGLLFIFLGLFTVFGAHYFLDTCADAGHFMHMGDKEIHMGCTWTERGVIGVGGLVAFMGLAMLIARESWRGLSLAAAGAGALMILIPLYLIPTCAMPNMPCNLSLKPGSLLLGGLVLVAGLISMIRFRKLDGAEAR